MYQKLYNRIDLSEVNDVNKTSSSKECSIYRYRYFLDNEFKFQSSVCNGCHDVLMMSIDIESIAI